MKTLLLFSTLLLCGPQLAGAVPSLINYQGRLVDRNGVGLSGSKDFSLKVYDAPEGGTLLYSETVGAITLGQGGVYSFQFGSAGTIDGEPASITGALADATQHWLELSIDGTAQATRERILTVPFALQAASVIDPDPIKELRYTRQFKGALGLSMKETPLNSSEGRNHQVSFPVPSPAVGLLVFEASIAGVGGLPGSDHSDITSTLNLKLVRLNADLSSTVLFETTQGSRSGGYEDYLPLEVELNTELEEDGDYYLVLSLSYERGNGNTGTDYVRFRNFPRLTYRR